jgi:hypothetical protein
MKNSAKAIMIEYIGFLRMMELWFHGAHHLTRGTAFGGDHVDIYGRIYEAIGSQVDPAVEKSIGLYSDKCADPVTITEKALEIMKEYPSPGELKPQAIAAVGLQIEKDFLVFSKNMYKTMKEMGAMTLGLDDMIMANANAHEGHAYLLKQRVRTSMGA